MPKYEFIKQGPNGEPVGTQVERRDLKMGGLVTTTGKYIPWEYLKAALNDKH